MKMLAYSVPPGYRRQTPPRRPKLEPYTGVIDRILEDDLARPARPISRAPRAPGSSATRPSGCIGEVEFRSVVVREASNFFDNPSSFLAMGSAA